MPIARGHQHDAKQMVFYCAVEHVEAETSEVPKSMTKAQKDKLREFDAALGEKNYQKRKGFTERLRDRFSDK